MKTAIRIALLFTIALAFPAFADSPAPDTSEEDLSGFKDSLVSEYQKAHAQAAPIKPIISKDDIADLRNPRIGHFQKLNLAALDSLEVSIYKHGNYHQAWGILEVLFSIGGTITVISLTAHNDMPELGTIAFTFVFPLIHGLSETRTGLRMRKGAVSLARARTLY